MMLPGSTEQWPEHWQELYGERAAIREFDAYQPRQDAEKLAEAEMRLQAEWSELT